MGLAAQVVLGALLVLGSRDIRDALLRRKFWFWAAAVFLVAVPLGGFVLGWESLGYPFRRLAQTFSGQDWSNLPRLYRERDEEGDGQLAEMVAQVAMMACERARARNSQDEWLNPTLLGLAFDAADLKRARECVKAVRREGHAAWKVETTLTDLQRSISQNPDPQAQQSLVAMLEELRALLGSANNP